jgi:AAA ATPase domain
MHPLTRVSIQNFRSIADALIGPLGDFTALAGLNNSGKSNVLRALNVFFNDTVDGVTPLDVDADYCRPRARARKRKRISVSVEFTLPSLFNFRKGDEQLKKFLGGSTFEIRKEWIRDSTQATYHLNGSGSLDSSDRALVDQFLSRITFRYIPNRVLPLDIIRNEHQALRDVLIRRLSNAQNADQRAFDELKKVSATLVSGINDDLRQASPDIGDVRLATPTTWQDMIFAFGYKLGTGQNEIDDAAQGSGIQSLLMFETLALIDRDYFKRFGWKQAAIWAVEEPESSMHSTLEARVANYLADIASAPTSRLQILATTHSDHVLQYADSALFVTKDTDGSSFSKGDDKLAVLQEAARAGISRWVHPILMNPLKPLLLVEGKSDDEFIAQALKFLGASGDISVSFVGKLGGGPATGGVEELLKYIKNSSSAIRARPKEAGVFVLLDWDAANHKKEFEKHLGAGHVFVWPDSSFNPRLGKAFRGLERHLPDQLLDKADESCGVLGSKADGARTIAATDLPALKSAVLALLEKGITPIDLQHVSTFLNTLIREIKTVSMS